METPYLLQLLYLVRSDDWAVIPQHVANNGVTVLIQDVGVLEQRLAVHKAVVVHFQKEFYGIGWGRFNERSDKLEHEHGLECQVVVRVHKVLLK